MELTPIKIPGKYKRSKTKSAVEARKALNRKPGRPFKPLQNALSKLPQTIAQPVKAHEQRTLKTLKSRRKMSLLERLPTELLERVFQFCLNLDLPSASSIIAGKLSSTRVFNWTVMRVFGASWDKGYGEKDLDVDGKQEGEGEWGEEDGEMQSRVLRCRWASLEVLLRAKGGWIQRFAGDRKFVPLYVLKSMNADTNKAFTPPPMTTSDMRPDPTTPTLEPDSPNPAPPRLTPSEFHTQDYTSFQSFLSAPDGPSPYPYINWSPSSTELAPTTEIPHSLLSPPFTPSSLQHLFYLLKSGLRISWLTSTSGEVAFAGLQAAIREGCVEAVHLLVWSGLLERLDAEIAGWAARNAGLGTGAGGVEGRLPVEERVRTLNQVLRLGYTAMDAKERGRIEAELLELRDEAIMDGDEDALKYVRRAVECETLRGKVDIRV